MTIYANGGHMYMVVAGLRFDTSGARPSRWQKDMRSSSGYTIRHPDGSSASRSARPWQGNGRVLAGDRGVSRTPRPPVGCPACAAGS